MWDKAIGSVVLHRVSHDYIAGTLRDRIYCIVGHFTRIRLCIGIYKRKCFSDVVVTIQSTRNKGYENIFIIISGTGCR